MSTLALGLAGGLAPAAKSEAKPGFWSRVIDARQKRRPIAPFARIWPPWATRAWPISVSVARPSARCARANSDFHKPSKKGETHVDYMMSSNAAQAFNADGDMQRAVRWQVLSALWSAFAVPAKARDDIRCRAAPDQTRDRGAVRAERSHARRHRRAAPRHRNYRPPRRDARHMR